MLGYSGTDSAIAPGTYQLTRNEWRPATGPSPLGIPLPDVWISIAVSHAAGRVEAFVGERPPGGADPVAVHILSIGIPVDNWTHRYPGLFDLLGQLMRRRKRAAGDPSAVDTVRALLDHLGFTDATPGADTGQTPTA